MFINVSESMFIDAFRNGYRKGQFSINALRAIYEYLTEFEDSSGDPIEFDVIAICCDFAEWGLDEYIAANDIEIEPDADADEKAEAIRDFCDDTIVDFVTDDNGEDTVVIHG